MKKVEREDFKLSDLTLYLENPRINRAATENLEIERLYVNKPYKMMNLIDSIANSGFDQAESIIVVKDKNKNIVFEGNRRIAALKILSNPTKYNFLSSSDLAKVKQYNFAIPSTISAVVESEKEAFVQIGRMHGGEQGGVGRTAWNAESKKRYAAAKLGKSTLSAALNTPFEQKYGHTIGEEFSGITTVDRLLGNKKIKELLLINKEKVTDDDLENVKTLLEMAKEIVADSDDSATRVFGTKRDIEAKLYPNFKAVLQRKRLTQQTKVANTVTPDQKNSATSGQSGSASSEQANPQNSTSTDNVSVDSSTLPGSNSGQETPSSNGSSQTSQAESAYSDSENGFFFKGLSYEKKPFFNFANREELISAGKVLVINNTMYEIASLWDKAGENTREQLSYLIAPSLRFLFEAGFKYLQKNVNTCKALHLTGVRCSGEEIEKIISKLRENNHFMTFMSKKDVYGGFNNLKNMLAPVQFKEQYGLSNPGAHMGRTYLTTSEVATLGKYGELMVCVVLNYVEYSK